MDKHEQVGGVVMTVREAFAAMGRPVPDGADIVCVLWPNFFYGIHYIDGNRCWTFSDYARTWIDVSGWFDEIKSCKDIANRPAHLYGRIVPAFAELLAMVLEPSSSETQAPSTTSHQTETRGSTTGLEKGGD